MNSREEIYRRYTSTSALAGSLSEKAELAWTKGYIRKSIAPFLPKDKNASILEIGCGFGICLKNLAELGYSDCRGIDISDEQINYAKEVFHLGNVQKANAIDFLSDKTDRFDCILALDVLEHFDLNQLMGLGTKIAFSLKSGGSLVVQVPNGGAPMNPYIYGDLTHVRGFSVKSLQQFFLLIGLTPYGFASIPPYVHNISSFIRNAAWRFFLHPIIHSTMVVMNGTNAHGIYTANFIGAARKQQGD